MKNIANRLAFGLIFKKEVPLALMAIPGHQGACTGFVRYCMAGGDETYLHTAFTVLLPDVWFPF
jgi:hypothetical protein